MTVVKVVNAWAIVSDWWETMRQSNTTAMGVAATTSRAWPLPQLPFALPEADPAGMMILAFQRVTGSALGLGANTI